MSRPHAEQAIVTRGSISDWSNLSHRSDSSGSLTSKSSAKKKGYRMPRRDNIDRNELIKQSLPGNLNVHDLHDHRMSTLVDSTQYSLKAAPHKDGPVNHHIPLGSNNPFKPLVGLGLIYGDGESPYNRHLAQRSSSNSSVVSASSRLSYHVVSSLSHDHKSNKQESYNNLPVPHYTHPDIIANTPESMVDDDSPSATPYMTPPTPHSDPVATVMAGVGGIKQKIPSPNIGMRILSDSSDAYLFSPATTYNTPSRKTRRKGSLPEVLRHRSDITSTSTSQPPIQVFPHRKPTLQHPTNVNLPHSIVQRDLGPKELTASSKGDTEPVVALVPVYHISQVDSINAFPHKNSLSNMSAHASVGSNDKLQPEVSLTSAFSTPAFNSHTGVPVNNKKQSQSNLPRATTTSPMQLPTGLTSLQSQPQTAPLSKQHRNEQPPVVERPDKRRRESIFEFFNLASHLQSDNLTPLMPQDPLTPTLQSAKSELRSQPPQKPLPLPKMRIKTDRVVSEGSRVSKRSTPSMSEQKLFETRTKYKRASSTRTFRAPSSKSVLFPPPVASPSFPQALTTERAVSMSTVRVHNGVQEQQQRLMPGSSASRAASASASTLNPLQDRPNSPLVIRPPPFATETGSTARNIPIPPLIHEQYPSFPDLPFALVSPAQVRAFSPGSSSLEAAEKDDERVSIDEFGRPKCRRDLAHILLGVFIFFPPLWLLMGFGFLDEVVGVVPRREKRLALLFAVIFLLMAVAGVVVGVVVGVK